ncbi:alpha/beta hydrolase like protein [Zymoseptoria brevis]|uniref:Alpha/beta hydrolase like protein n=1 Tax=Zymoseptoria brevis TaxID=1047168 RepID=A0A0F4GUM9_9PEZI|nr:alpha/beta hydrolase like protein [Zymoseptoria brevis]
MPSQASSALADLFIRLGAAFPADENSYIERCVYDQIHTAAVECPDVSYDETIIADRPCLCVKPAGASQKHVMLLFHGGGYSFGSPMSHRKLTAHLAKACNVTAISVDYRLAPYPAPLDDCVAAYQALIQTLGYAPTNIVLAGDSAGGSLTAAVCLAAAKKDLPMPGASIALSPCYDLTHSGETMKTNAEVDVLQSMEFCKNLAQRYTAGKVSADDPLVSPIFAELKGLPPQWISCGGYDMLLDNGTRFAEKAKKAGVEVVLEVHEGQQHVMEFMAGKAEEADGSIQRIGQWVRQKIGS